MKHRMMFIYCARTWLLHLKALSPTAATLSTISEGEISEFLFFGLMLAQLREDGAAEHNGHEPEGQASAGGKGGKHC